MRIKYILTILMLPLAIAASIDIAMLPPEKTSEPPKELKRLGYTANYYDHISEEPDMEPIPSKPVVLTPLPTDPPASKPPTPKPTPEVTASLLKALIQTESGGNPRAVSPRGAVGLTQLEPATAREMHVRHIFDPRENRKGGEMYLTKLIVYYGDRTFGLMAYNWGVGNVDRWLAHGAHLSQVPKQTRDYIAKINMNEAIANYQTAEKE